MDPATHRLFFALRPPAPVTLAIEQVVSQLKTAGRVHGRWLEPSKYHITLHFLGTYDHFPDDVLARATAAIAHFTAHVQDVEFDRVATFARDRSPPCVLRCSPQTEAGLQEQARRLRGALAAAGVDMHEEHAYTPHLTIGYSDHALAEPVPIAPLAWRPHEFVLIDSHVGTGRHAQLARWLLVA
jgi:2'-5' RNA ligase